MKKVLFLVAILAFSANVFAQDAEKGLGGRDFIEVRGNAVTVIEPNQISVAVMLSENETKGKVLMAELEKKFAVALKESGVDVKKDVVMTGQSSAADKKKGAFLFKNYTVTLTSAEMVNRLFNALRDNEINSASIIRSWNSNQMAIMDSLKAEAVKNAQSVAKLMADALGQKVGPAIQIIDNNYYQPADGGYFRPNYMMAKSANEDSESVLDDAGYKKNTLSQNVVVRFYLHWK